MPPPYYRITISFALAVFALYGTHLPAGAQENGNGAKKYAESNKLTLELLKQSYENKVYVKFSNDSSSTLWFPINEAPASSLNLRTCMIKLWFGYHDEVPGQDIFHYMMPKMHPVRPGHQFKYELTSPSLVKNLLSLQFGTAIRARVATKDFQYSQVRGGQPIEEYIENSIIINQNNSSRCSDNERQ